MTSHVTFLEGPEILCYWKCCHNYVWGLCLSSVVVETVVVRYILLPLGSYQWMEQPQLIGASVGVGMVVRAVVPLTILRN